MPCQVTMSCGLDAVVRTAPGKLSWTINCQRFGSVDNLGYLSVQSMPAGYSGSAACGTSELA